MDNPSPDALLYQRPYALTCHPERSEGSPWNGWRFFASLRMTVSLFIRPLVLFNP